MKLISLLVLACLAVATAFSPAPMAGLSLRQPALRATRVVTKMAEEAPKADLKKEDNPFSLFMDSIMKLFKKSEDDYPPAEGKGFTQTPNKPQRNKW
eukprot:CAMPEP_0206214174 /NCGR_PEP_ID=MMETSP0047_2-20121206/1525_1 /ASSEMBLY_ACC=CAM_ASM_000192 /TAXON_ID=195065 /ORGANISM="Chroomonas mesostigmatica_cf, Strain CCMP1168" /LENGTH=96 /DNA_ID=CAMNT_0053636393 /DNA_START=36 /DNA_END=326 /DNA_ORIENTATION=-